MKYLAYLVGLLAICFAPLQAQAQNDAISKYFDQYVDNEDFTVVYVSAKMFELISRLEIDEIEDNEEAKAAMEVVNDLKSIRVLTTENDPGRYYQEAINKINTNEYEMLVKVRDEGENIQLLIKDDGTSPDAISELLVLVGGEDEFVLVSLLGLIDLKKVSNIANMSNLKGLEHLDKLEDKEKNGAQ
ncbi:MAG: DUF4252 domain-containing protein [Bacteroidota bacterium]